MFESVADENVDFCQSWAYSFPSSFSWSCRENELVKLRHGARVILLFEAPFRSKCMPVGNWRLYHDTQNRGGISRDSQPESQAPVFHSMLKNALK
jgi:hypothetical protein